MPLNAASVQRLTLVNPKLSVLIYLLYDLMLQQTGQVITVAQGLRTWAEQDALYAQGRTAPGKIVTNARGGYSWHNFGLAADCYPVTLQGAVDWNAQHPVWKTMEQLGVQLGMESGANWVRFVDAPHFQLRGTLEAPGAPDDSVRSTYQQAESAAPGSGLQAVWQAAGLV